MPARRRSYSQKKSAKKKRLKFFFLAIFGLLILTLFFYFNNQRRFWNGEDKLPLVINRGTEGVSVAVFDPVHEEIVTVNIPPNTQVNVARKLGVWKLDAVWQLGQNENLDGRLLAETITRHFNFPSTAWADRQAVGFVDSNPSSLIGSVLSPYKTNLSISDRISLAIFSSSVQPTDRIDINLEETILLEKDTLKSGEEGYVLSNRPAPQVYSLFADPEITESLVSVSIEDGTGTSGISENMGKTVEVLGAKVASIQDQDVNEIDCIVSSADQVILEKFSVLFNCEVEKKVTPGGFDVQIKIGETFAKRY